MIDLDHTRSVLVAGLEQELKITVQHISQPGELPDYPYLLYSTPKLLVGKGRGWETYEDGSAGRTINQVWRFAVVAASDEQAAQICLQAYQWFAYTGTVDLNDNQIIVEKVEDITDQSGFVDNVYQCKYGFEIILCLPDNVPSRLLETGFIEYAEVKQT